LSLSADWPNLSANVESDVGVSPVTMVSVSVGGANTVLFSSTVRTEGVKRLYHETVQTD